MGFVLLPAQSLCFNAKDSRKVIESSVPYFSGNVDFFTVPVEKTDLGGVVHYPNAKRNSKTVILYNNPNAATVADYFKSARFDWTPAEFAEAYNAPIILYDYRGTGLSRENTSGFKLRANNHSLIQDGKAMLSFALKNFEKVIVIGSSLGGAIGTIALSEYLKDNIADTTRVSLINHDSFTTTPRVAFPMLRKIADMAGWAAGAMLDAAKPMQHLLSLKIPIKIFCHEKDPVIPKGARMADWIQTLPASKNHPSLTILRENQSLDHAGLQGFDLR